MSNAVKFVMTGLLALNSTGGVDSGAQELKLTTPATQKNGPNIIINPEKERIIYAYDLLFENLTAILNNQNDIEQNMQELAVALTDLKFGSVALNTENIKGLIEKIMLENCKYNVFSGILECPNDQTIYTDEMIKFYTPIIKLLKKGLSEKAKNIWENGLQKNIDSLYNENDLQKSIDSLYNELTGEGNVASIIRYKKLQKDEVSYIKFWTSLISVFGVASFVGLVFSDNVGKQDEADVGIGNISPFKPFVTRVLSACLIGVNYVAANVSLQNVGSYIIDTNNTDYGTTAMITKAISKNPVIQFTTVISIVLTLCRIMHIEFYRKNGMQRILENGKLSNNINEAEKDDLKKEINTFSWWCQYSILSFLSLYYTQYMMVNVYDFTNTSLSDLIDNPSDTLIHGFVEGLALVIIEKTFGYLLVDQPVYKMKQNAKTAFLAILEIINNRITIDVEKKRKEFVEMENTLEALKKNVLSISRFSAGIEMNVVKGCELEKEYYFSQDKEFLLTEEVPKKKCIVSEGKDIINKYKFQICVNKNFDIYRKVADIPDDEKNTICLFKKVESKS